MFEPYKYLRCPLISTLYDTKKHILFFQISLY